MAATFVALSCLGPVGSSCQTSSYVELTIFHTNDIHSHLRAPKTSPFGLGGLARLSTLLQSLRKQSPVSVTLDAGDWSEGTWYYSVNEGANMLQILSSMGYDGACLGNHDFLQGPDQLIKTIGTAQATFPVLAANLDMSAYPNAVELAGALPQSTIKTVGGIRVGIIGLTTFQPTYGAYIAPVVITNATDAATQLALAMKPNVDVLLLVSHNDFQDNVQLAQAVPGIDAVISGHSHVKTPTAVFVQNAGRQVAVVETGSWGEFLGDLKLSVDTGAHAVIFKSYQLHPVTPDLAEDPVVADLVTRQDQALDTEYNVNIQQILADSDADLLQADSSESLLGNLAVQAYRHETGADLSFEEISLTGVSVPHGNVTLQDLHDVVPHIFNPATGKEWMLNVWNARGSDVALIVSVFYTTAGLMPLSTPLGWLSADNAVINWNPANTVPFVQSIQIGGQQLDPAGRYKVALTDGLLSAIRTVNSGAHLGIDLSQITNTGVEAWRAIANYAASIQHLTVANLGVGRNARTLTPDLAIFYYDMDWDELNLSLIVHNNGLQVSQTSTLTCYSGLANDFVNYSAYPTDLEKWSKIGIATLPAIPAGGAITAKIPWSSAGLAPGYWPIKCDLATQGDPYDVNNHVLRVFHF